MADDFGNAVNRTEDLKQQVVTATEVLDGEGDVGITMQKISSLPQFWFDLGCRE